jgi:hypothetical protein
MIDWTKLQGINWKSFEGFCYVLAQRNYVDQGIFTNLDDSGGGDGVEFYLTLNNGKEWGWQAKFYHPNKQLNSSRKRSIKNSLKRSMENHENLEKWILCTPHPFSPSGNDWVEEELINEIPDDREIKLVHWEMGYFENELSKAENIGVLNYFFGDKELNLAFFRDLFEDVLEIVGRNYFPEVHAKPTIEECILENYSFERLEKLSTTFSDYLVSLRKISIQLNEPPEFGRYYSSENRNEFRSEILT